MASLLAFLAGSAFVVLVLVADDYRLKRKAKAEVRKHFRRR